jgi:hypothetical protein
MSAKAVTVRLKLASELRDLCLSLRKAKIESKPAARRSRERKRERGLKNSK